MRAAGSLYCRQVSEPRSSASTTLRWLLYGKKSRRNTRCLHYSRILKKKRTKSSCFKRGWFANLTSSPSLQWNIVPRISIYSSFLHRLQSTVDGVQFHFIQWIHLANGNCYIVIRPFNSLADIASSCPSGSMRTEDPPPPPI